MSNENAKSHIEKARSIISQMREMLHYSESNIEKLGEFWLFLNDQMKHKEFTTAIEEILTLQNNFHQSAEIFVDDL